ncbi:transcriptional regulator, LysR family [Azotobacter beijerinckii]|uniref:Transcriptional regulator, LysR family n=1 Tax=Azotobacter beijerinckii TaxID=170623 RepID=A0A1H6YU40_9GAMM|nr:LysR family transcriptional regulator [Azotobacter beijerinckii]SEJ43836.1 transcriptional regulator, LysR family [Azotobacter beijerinckii]SER17624.1 transcriptional regulator, LysR family [Azotobacter beijerinckii]
MSLPDLNLLVALNVLLEEGSVVAAARRMHLSAPAMSRTLGRIREAVGDPIMVRAGRNLVPTPRALELQEQVRQLVEQATRLFHSGEHFDLAGLERCFTLRANNVLVGDMAARLLQELGREAPRCTLRFVPEVEHDDAALRRNRIDLFIGALPGLEPEAKTQRLFSTRFVGLARRDHPLFDGEISPERFAAYPQVSVSRRGRACGPIDEELEKLGLQRDVRLVTPSFHGTIFCLLESDLLLPIPEHALWRLERLGLGLRQFAIPLPLKPFEVIQAWHPRFDNDVAHRWLRRTVAQVCLDLCASSAPLV